MPMHCIFTCLAQAAKAMEAMEAFGGYLRLCTRRLFSRLSARITCISRALDSKTANLGQRQTLPNDSLNIHGRLRHFQWQTSPLPKGYPKGWHNLIQFAGTPGGRERIPLKSGASDKSGSLPPSLKPKWLRTDPVPFRLGVLRKLLRN